MTTRGCLRAWNTISAILVMPAIFALASCNGTLQLRNATPRDLGGSSVQDAAETTRGILVERPRLGFDHALQVRRSKNDVPHELHDGDTLMTGARIHASVVTAEEAYLYLAFCTHQELTLTPSHDGIRTRAGELMVVPQAGVELVLDDVPGPEVLYVILSRNELSAADPRLAAALAAQRPSTTPVDCGTSLDAKLAKVPSTAGAERTPTLSSTNASRREVVSRKPLSSAHAPTGQRPASPPLRAARTPSSGSSGAKDNPPLPDTAPTSPATAPPDPGYERDPTPELVAADDDGIAVVRHAFTHVAVSPP